MSVSVARPKENTPLNKEQMMFKIVSMNDVYTASSIIKNLRDYAEHEFRITILGTANDRSSAYGECASKEKCDAALVDVLCKLDQFESWVLHKLRDLEISETGRTSLGSAKICPQQVFEAVRSVTTDMYMFIILTSGYLCFNLDYPKRISRGPLCEDTEFEKYLRNCGSSADSSSV